MMELGSFKIPGSGTQLQIRACVLVGTDAVSHFGPTPKCPRTGLGGYGSTATQGDREGF